MWLDVQGAGTCEQTLNDQNCMLSMWVATNIWSNISGTSNGQKYEDTTIWCKFKCTTIRYHWKKRWHWHIWEHWKTNEKFISKGCWDCNIKHKFKHLYSKEQSSQDVCSYNSNHDISLELLYFDFSWHLWNN